MIYISQACYIVKIHSSGREPSISSSSSSFSAFPALSQGFIILGEIFMCVTVF